ncbi:MAG: adenylate/guanylate cyclase domain-containing protein, partial [bacterium]
MAELCERLEYPAIRATARYIIDGVEMVEITGPERGARAAPRTFFLTDIEGSTRLWQAHPQAMKEALARHDSLLRSAVEGHGGRVFKAMGDAFFAVFVAPKDAVRAGAQALLDFQNSPASPVSPLKVRIAIHTGEAEERDNDFFGAALNRCSRMLGVANGGQALVSEASEALVRDALPDGVALKDLGAHRLKDLLRPEHLYQLVHPDLPSDFPPLRSLT